MTSDDYPQNWEDLDLGHHIVHHTFWPVLFTSVALVASAPIAYYYDHVTLGLALTYPWVAVLGICLYFGFLGDYVIPSETYRKYRSGEWDNAE